MLRKRLAMGCDRILQLLKKDWQGDGEEVAINRKIVAHIRSCPLCCHGLVRLSVDLLNGDRLTCDQCSLRFPDYYEATRPSYPLVKMPPQQIAEIARHLSNCPSCHEEYEELVLLGELEERKELL
ncbi:MAG: hypothetical protein JO011_06285 [Ktedonobacteraceae bacterium]|nr:hypothetical protein [Ktedonobacteraceae bacterium]